MPFLALGIAPINAPRKILPIARLLLVNVTGRHRRQEWSAVILPLPNVAPSNWHILPQLMPQSRSPRSLTATPNRPLKATLIGARFAPVLTRRLTPPKMEVLGVLDPPWARNLVITLVLFAINSPLNIALGGEKDTIVTGQRAPTYPLIDPRKGVTLAGPLAPKHNLSLEIDTL